MLSETTDTTDNSATHADPLLNPIAELDILSATELKALYPREYTCWRNMKQRCKDKGVPAHSEFQHVGFHAELSRFFHREVSHL